MCIYKELAIQISSNDKTVRNVTIQDIEDFNQKSLTTQAKKGEQLFAMVRLLKKLLIFYVMIYQN